MRSLFGIPLPERKGMKRGGTAGRNTEGNLKAREIRDNAKKRNPASLLKSQQKIAAAAADRSARREGDSRFKKPTVTGNQKVDAAVRGVPNRRQAANTAFEAIKAADIKKRYDGAKVGKELRYRDLGGADALSQNAIDANRKFDDNRQANFIQGPYGSTDSKPSISSYYKQEGYKDLPYLSSDKTPGFGEDLALGGGTLLAGIMNALTGNQENAFKEAYNKRHQSPDGSPLPEGLVNLAYENHKSRTRKTMAQNKIDDAQAVVDRKEAREGDARDPVTGQRIRDLDFECPEGYTFNEAEQRCEIIQSAVAGAGAGIPTPPGGGFPDLTNAGVTTGVPVVNNQYTQFAAPTLAGLPAAATNGFVMPMMNTQPITIAQQTPQGLAGLQQQILRNAGMQTG